MSEDGYPDRPPTEDRLANKRYAKNNGLFWLPCDLCGFWYGGHEWNTLLSFLGPSGAYKGVCDYCGKEEAKIEFEKAWNKATEAVFFSFPGVHRRRLEYNKETDTEQ